MDDQTLHDLKEANLKIKILITMIDEDKKNINLIEKEAERIIGLCRSLEVLQG
jgi:hypothetical protein